jgi:NADPH:quinone reductase-like Zn-dependent oxidoreductase
MVHDSEGVLPHEQASEAGLVALGGLLESRKVTHVIDTLPALSETSEAFRRIASGHARGKIVVMVDPSGGTAGE